MKIQYNIITLNMSNNSCKNQQKIINALHSLIYLLILYRDNYFNINLNYNFLLKTWKAIKTNVLYCFHIGIFSTKSISVLFNNKLGIK